MKSRSGVFACLFGAAMLSCGLPAQALSGFSIAITEASSTLNGYGNAINTTGQVAGSTWSAVQPETAALWSSGIAQNIGPAGSSRSAAYAINAAGGAAGIAEVGGWLHGVYWNGASMSDLGTLGGRSSGAYGINDSGNIVGFSDKVGGGYHAVLWSGGTATDLGTLGGDSSHAFAINNQGQIVGEAVDAAGRPRPATWIGIAAVDLGTLGGVGGAARSINDIGQIVGISMTLSGAQHATLWSNGLIVDLGTLGGVSSGAYGINRLGQVAGWYVDASNSSKAALWSDGVAVDLNGYLDAEQINAGWVLERATSINDSGAITGAAFNKISGKTSAFLLTASPVPEPRTLALLLVGGTMLLIMELRRKRKLSAASEGIRSSARHPRTRGE